MADLGSSGNEAAFKTLDPSLSGLPPLPAVYIGDYDRDGYPDVAFLTQGSRLTVLKSYPCEGKDCQEGGRRSFKAESLWESELSKVPGDVLSASWVDLNEDVTFFPSEFLKFWNLIL